MPCRTLSPGGQMRRELTWLIRTALSRGVSADGVYHPGPAWGFLVGVHGNPTQASSDVSCSGRFSYCVWVPALPQGWP